MYRVDFVSGQQASPYHDFFQIFFESADIVSAFWQPVMKSIGRQQLELANLSARQGQSMLQFVRNVSTAPSPAGVATATQHFWQSMADEYVQSTRKLASVVTDAAHQSATSEVLALPVLRRRDVMSVYPADSQAMDERKVA